MLQSESNDLSAFCLIICPLIISTNPPDFAPCAGALATLVDGKLVCLSSATGSPKIDLAASLDLFALAESFAFSERMRNEAVALLEGLEVWVEKQGGGMEMAVHHKEQLSVSFDNLLKVMDSLYQVSVCVMGV